MSQGDEADQLVHQLGGELRGQERFAHGLRDGHPLLHREEMLARLVEAEELLELLDLKLAADPLPLPVRQLQPETGELVEQGEQWLEAFGFDPPREVPPVEPGVGVDTEADLEGVRLEGDAEVPVPVGLIEVLPQLGPQLPLELGLVITTVSLDFSPAQEAAVKADALLDGSLLWVVKNLTRTQAT